METLHIPLLLISLLYPFLAALVHARFSGNQARLALLLQGVYGLFLVLFSGYILFAGREFAAGAIASLPIANTGISFLPSFYLQPANATFLLLIGLASPLVFYWLRDTKNQFGASYYVAANLLLFSLVGVFISESLFFFYLFWELALVAAYFWIGQHGKANIYAGAVYPALVRFLLYTLLGSLPMLFSIIALCAAAGKDPGIHGISRALFQLPEAHRSWVFFGFLLGFGVKMPLFGLHGWMRDTYSVAAPACRALLSGVMSKMGAYGFIFVLWQGFGRELHAYSLPLQILCVAGILYGGLLCLAAERFLDLLVYSSLAHLGLLGLGIFSGAKLFTTDSTALTAALFQVLNHGLIMAALFALDARITAGGESPTFWGSGAFRGPQRRLSALLLCAIFASVSLPGLSNFAGEILIYYGAFRTSPWLTFAAAVGSLITAAALVRAFHKVFFGAPSITPQKQAADLSLAETAAGVALFAVWLVLGLYPMLYLAPVERSVLEMTGAVSGIRIP